MDGEQVKLHRNQSLLEQRIRNWFLLLNYFGFFFFFLVEPCVSSRCLYSWPFFQTNGNSNGLVPMLRVYNNTARYVDQGGNKVYFVTGKCWRSELKIFSYKSWFSYILFYFVFKDLFYSYLCDEHVYISVSIYKWVLIESRRGHWILGAGALGGCGPSSVCVGNRAWVSPVCPAPQFSKHHAFLLKGRILFCNKLTSDLLCSLGWSWILCDFF